MAESLSRRQAIKKGAVGAAAAGLVWTGPRIERMTMRPAYAAASSGTADINFVDFALDGVQSGTGVTATGVGSVTVNPSIGALSGTASWFGLTGNATVAHIHGPAAAPGGNAGVVLDLTVDNLMPVGDGTAQGAGVVAPATAQDICDNPHLYYINIHSGAHGGGEIRGQLAPTPQ